MAFVKFEKSDNQVNSQWLHENRVIPATARISVNTLFFNKPAIALMGTTAGDRVHLFFDAETQCIGIEKAPANSKEGAPVWTVKHGSLPTGQAVYAAAFLKKNGIYKLPISPKYTVSLADEVPHIRLTPIPKEDQ